MTDSETEEVGGASVLPKSNMGVSSDQVDDQSQAASMESALYTPPQVGNTGTTPPLDLLRVTRCAARQKSTKIGGSSRTRGLPITAKKKP